MFGEIAAAHKLAPRLLYGESVLSGTFTISATVGTFADTGLSVSLPGAGVYFIGYNVRGLVALNAATNGFITAKLYRSDTASYVANSERFVIIEDTATDTALENRNHQLESAYSTVVAVNSACQINLYVKRDGGATAGQFANVNLQSDANGYTTLFYIKIA